MRKIIIALVIFSIFTVTAFGIMKSDKVTKEVAGFLDGNVLFEIKDGTVTILNEEFRLP